ncbi:MAG: energy-coupling factor transporter ATPase [Lachnospiraceae bacterium]|nr:energy-coupling factor transporter ATPase [Lachnospiraceae bacterium]
MTILVNHLTYKYNPGTPMESVAVDDVSFELKEGEFVGLIGHTGSGKSTLVQHLNGILKPSFGSVYYNGRDVFDGEYDLKELRSHVGLVFQYPEHQLFETDVFKDVCFGPKNLGLSQKETELRAYKALKLVGLEDDFFYQSPFDLSGGQKRRVAIAGVLAMEPEVLVLDEPTAGLDPKGRDDLLESLKKVQTETGCTVVLVSHCMEDVAEYADRLLVMHKGKLEYDDKPVNVFRHSARLKEMGLGIPEITDAMIKLKANGFDVSTDVITVKEAVEEILKCFPGR